MTQYSEEMSPLDDVWVALDLETTGLSTDNDEIIEVGAVKFQGSRTLDTFQSFVNPQRKLSNFVRRYTGITQELVDNAQPFSTVSKDLRLFIEGVPIVGHNIAFDINFLSSQGIDLPNPRSDTWDMAFVLLPELREYSLSKLAQSLGIIHPDPHRALHDAEVTRDVFLRLTKMASEIDVYTVAQMERLAARSSWVLLYLLRRLVAGKITALAGQDQSWGTGIAGGNASIARDFDEEQEHVGHAPDVLDIRRLRRELRRSTVLSPHQTIEKVDLEMVESLLDDGGSFAKLMQGFEKRDEQISMARAVTDAINEGKRLIVEAGTGVGKSLAYLLPAALYAMANNCRVVVSTNTLNLQEQLLNKDLPELLEVLKEAGFEGVNDFRFSLLKGRVNYLCLKRWLHLAGGDRISDDEARLLSKILVWLRSTGTGDRSELNLANRHTAMSWDRISAQGARDCIGVNGVCFLRGARERASASHLLVVNHALLMSDIISDRALIPEHDILIVDEAHHLEREATRHMGFEIAQSDIEDLLQTLGGDRALLNRAMVAMRRSKVADTGQEFEEIVDRILSLLPQVHESAGRMFGALAGLMNEVTEGTPAVREEVRVTSGSRAQPGWSQLEIEWENVDVVLSQLQKEMLAVITGLENLDETDLADNDDVGMELANVVQRNEELRRSLAEFIPHPKPDWIYWARRIHRGGDLILHSAPIRVGEQLKELIYAQKKSVILTGATLSAGGTFEHLRERSGFDDAEELILGSPFDYPSAALLCVPNDMPEPTSWAYQAAVEQAITDAVVAADGRTMALFTSHASLQAAASSVRGDLQARGINVLAQGVDGPPHRIVQSFLDNPKSILLGTASFWEGVDLPGESLKVLVVARLPFSVPTEPVFAARSELYEDAFREYALPQAIIRFKQGFGRLIRTKLDKGVVIILDRRITARSYGKIFLKSLPSVPMKACRLLDMPAEVTAWIRP